MKSNADQDVKPYVVNMTEQPCCKSKNIFWQN